MKRLSVFIILCLVLVACGDSKNELTRDDLCIFNEGKNITKVCYGMEKTAIDKILGTSSTSSVFTEYESGVSIMYRNNKVAGIALSKGSEKNFKTNRGGGIGMKQNEIKKIYGSKTLTDKERNIDYAFDSVNNKFIQNNDNVNLTPQELEATNMVSVTFDENGLVERIMLLDRMMAVYLK